MIVGCIVAPDTVAPPSARRRGDAIPRDVEVADEDAIPGPVSCKAVAPPEDNSTPDFWLSWGEHRLKLGPRNL